ncbi:uncharacterized protein LOC129616019 [Condylostylus longicornis]|uniref:uncharacterized protein LOC129616019 n=1 Tax=Condylostylus longicornis TaxID=2530218 RepID=UPI00244DDEB6|nr:uncharacterized protein LOC129616019 [Condylostylus longicornis]
MSSAEPINLDDVAQKKELLVANISKRELAKPHKQKKAFERQEQDRYTVISSLRLKNIRYILRKEKIRILNKCLIIFISVSYGQPPDKKGLCIHLNATIGYLRKCIHDLHAGNGIADGLARRNLGLTLRSHCLPVGEMVPRQGLVVLNRGITPTFRRHDYTGTISDISRATENVDNIINEWRVMEDFTGSDHQYITFSIEAVPRSSRKREVHEWNVTKLNKIRLAETLQVRFNRMNETQIEDTGRAKAERIAEDTMVAIKAAYDEAMPKKRINRERRPVYWWTPEISDLRKECIRLRRAAQRKRNGPEAAQAFMVYRTARKTLSISIGKRKAKCWRDLLKDVDEDPWGLGYKIVLKRIGSPTNTEHLGSGKLEEIVDALFPRHPIETMSLITVTEEDVPRFILDELKEAASTIKNRKALEPDGIQGEVIKEVVNTCLQILLGAYSTCLEEGVFWKGQNEFAVGGLLQARYGRETARKIIEGEAAGSHRSRGGLADMQYGFRKGKCTMNATKVVVDAVRAAESGNHHSRKLVLLVTLDVKNAFNSARWEDILQQLHGRFRVPAYLQRILEDYLSDRSLQYSIDGGIVQNVSR